MLVLCEGKLYFVSQTAYVRMREYYTKGIVHAQHFIGWIKANERFSLPFDDVDDIT